MKTYIGIHIDFNDVYYSIVDLNEGKARLQQLGGFATSNSCIFSIKDEIPDIFMNETGMSLDAVVYTKQSYTNNEKPRWIARYADIQTATLLGIEDAFHDEMLDVKKTGKFEYMGFEYEHISSFYEEENMDMDNVFDETFDAEDFSVSYPQQIASCLCLYYHKNHGKFA